MKELIRRKLFRMLALFYPWVYYNFKQEEVIYVSGAIAAVAVIIESLRFYSKTASRITEKIFSRIGKQEEAKRVSGITYMTLGALFTVIFFPKEIAIPVLLCAIITDGISSIVTRLFGKTKIFRNKSVESVIFCFIVCMAIDLMLLKTKLVLAGFNLRIAIGVALLTVLFDILPISADDNLTTPIFTGLIAQLLL